MPAKWDREIPALLLADFYKTCHRAFYHPKTTQLVSYLTPRKSRIDSIDEVVVFGLQAFIKKYLIDRFNTTFFERDFEDVEREYVEYICATFDGEVAKDEIKAFRQVYELGYLPIQIRSVPEGTKMPIGCPMIEFRATEDWAFWLSQYLETVSLSSLWYTMTAATIAYNNRKLLDTWYEKTVDDTVLRCRGAGDFSMRGMPGEDAAVLADAGHLLSFESTATIPTPWWLHCFYNAPFTVGVGTPSLEHSVLESYGKEQEEWAFEHIATEVMPHGNISMVSDTWDLWKVIGEYTNNLKAKFMQRDGKVIFRPDSGDPVEILCGTMVSGGKTAEEKGVVELLWDIVGGTTNSKGYRVLDKHFGVVYGDAITQERAELIFSKLEEKGFASNNVILGFGAYTYQFVTRDTFGFALKVTHGIVDGVEKEMFKDPITDRGDNGAGKKSQKGMCIVHKDNDGRYYYTDGHSIAEADSKNELRTVFIDGKLLIDEDFETIRCRLNPNF